jgi:hypothetical protein
MVLRHARGDGVMAYVVARRSRELGLRAALGASPRALFAQVAGRGLVLTAFGGTIGLARWPPAGSSRVSSSTLLPPIR